MGPIVDIQIRERGAFAPTDIVHQDRHVSKLCDGPFVGLNDLLRISNIRLYRMESSIAGNQRTCFRQAFRIQIDAHDLRALMAKCTRDCPPDPGSGTGY